MEAILACHPVLFTKRLDWVACAKSYELRRIRPGSTKCLAISIAAPFPGSPMASGSEVWPLGIHGVLNNTAKRLKQNVWRVWEIFTVSYSKKGAFFHSACQAQSSSPFIFFLQALLRARAFQAHVVPFYKTFCENDKLTVTMGFVTCFVRFGGIDAFWF